MRAITTTCPRSDVGRRDSTTPSSTSLCLILVLPASSPSTLAKLMAMIGPRSDSVRQPSQPAASAAISGSSQMIDTRWRTRSAEFAEGKGTSSAIVNLRGIPHQTWIETLGCEHRCNHHTTKRKNAYTGFDGCNPTERDECGQQRRYKNVNHRPATDEFNNPIEPSAILDPTA